MKLSSRGNFNLINITSSLLMLFAFSPAFAGDNDRHANDIDLAMGQDLQEKVVLQLQQAMDAEIILSYENMLAQQISANMEQVALAVTIEPNPVISMDTRVMMAKVDSVEQTAPVEDDEDCFKIQ